MSELPTTLEHYEPALKALEKFLLEKEEPKTKLTCSVLCFSTPKDGLRVSEISFCYENRLGGVSGWSYQRSEPTAGNVILAAEDFILTYFDEPWTPEGWDSPIDEHGDAKWKLEFVLKKDG